MKYKSGIYRITHAASGKTYVGSSSFIHQRWSQHRTRLRRGDHHCQHLQSSWTKHGESAFEFSVIEVCNRDDLLQREQYYLDTLKPKYNVLRIAGSAKGYKHSKETIEKMMGREVSAETRAKLSKRAKERDFGKARLGAAQAPGARANISAAMQGKQHTLGIPWTEESKRKSSETQKGRVFSDEHRAKMKQAWEIRRIREKGKVRSPEHCAALKQAWALRKRRA